MELQNQLIVHMVWLSNFSN